MTCTSKLSRKRNYTSTDEWAEEQYRQNFFLPVLFHNLKSYDAHFVIKNFQRKYVESRNSNNEVNFDDIKITPLNSEKYLSFQIGNLRFLDSYQFLSTSLEQLVSLLLKGGEKTLCTRRNIWAATTRSLPKDFTHIAIWRHQNGSRKPLCHRSSNSTIPSKTSRCLRLTTIDPGRRDRVFLWTLWRIFTIIIC